MTAFEYLITDRGGPGLVPRVERVPRLKQKPASSREEIFASANTAFLLHALGDDVELEDEEQSQRARDIFQSGREPTAHERRIPALVTHLEAMLTEYDYDLVRDATSIRNYVTNKLLEETTSKNPQVRIKALQMLGNITEVGLFTHRIETTTHNKSEEELTQLIREKLSGAVQKAQRVDDDVVDADYIEAKEASSNTSFDEVMAKIGKANESNS